MEVSYIAQKVNDLSCQWAQTFEPGKPTVASGLGIWVLLAILLDGAEGDAKSELEQATGLRQSEAADAVRSLLDSLKGFDEFKAAVAIWVRDSIDLLPEFVGRFPSVNIDGMPESQSVLDQWASAHTDQMIEKFPLEIDPEALMVLASALVAKGTWEVPFFDYGSGFLAVSYEDLNKAAIISTDAVKTGRVVVSANEEMDVYLVSGDQGQRPGDVLGSVFAELNGTAHVVPGDQLEDGQQAGCLRARLTDSLQDEINVSIQQFHVESTHSLLQNAEVFGLDALNVIQP